MSETIFIIGITGLQGYPAAKGLLEAGFKVKGLTASKDAKSEELEKLGAEIVIGDLFALEGLTQAMTGSDSLLFIPALPTAKNPLTEITVGYNVITAAEEAGIQNIIHTSVDRAGDHESFANWGLNFGGSQRYYWLAKSAVIDMVKASKIPHWSIFKPAYMMDVFLPPRVTGMHPLLKDGVLAFVQEPNTKITMMNTEVQAELIVKAFSDFAAFDKQSLGLASDRLSIEEVAEILTQVTGKSVSSEHVSAEEFKADTWIITAYEEAYKNFKGASVPEIITSSLEGSEWTQTDGYTADPEVLASYGIRSTFKDWAEAHRGDFDIN